MVVSEAVVAAEVGAAARAPLVVVFPFRPLGFVFGLATHLVELALVILPLFAQARVVHCHERPTVSQILLHREISELELREISLRDVFAATVLLAREEYDLLLVLTLV